MRVSSLFALAAAAFVGGLVALGIGAAAGWVGSHKTTTVVVAQPASGAPVPAAVNSARPLTGNGFDPARIYVGRSPGVVTIFAYFGDSTTGATAETQGSGFVVSRKGIILTNSHVVTTAGTGDTGAAVRAARNLYVEFADHDRVPAKIVGWDVFDDVGVIRVDPKAHRLEPVPLGNSAQVVVGEPVAVIGSPFGNENSLSVGVVSATHRSISALTSNYRLADAIQTDAPINHGNSGGPLFDARGLVIGINSQIRSDTGAADGVGFAVPIDSARRSLRQLVATGRVAYAYIGIRTEDLTPSIARRFGYGAEQGALIDSVTPGTGAGRAGLRGASSQQEFEGVVVGVGGDAVTAIDGIPVRSADDLSRIVSEVLVPGTRATFTVLRGQRTLTVPVKLGSRPLSPDVG
jgi:S1-C subfamily serine protease